MIQGTQCAVRPALFSLTSRPAAAAASLPRRLNSSCDTAANIFPIAETENTVIYKFNSISGLEGMGQWAIYYPSPQNFFYFLLLCQVCDVNIKS